MSYYKKLIFQIIGLFFTSFLFSETWNVDANGNWGTSTNWSPATVPNSSSTDVYFTTVITAPRTVNVDGTYSVQNMTLQNAQPYTFSNGVLNLNGSIFVLAPVASHEIESNVVLLNPGGVNIYTPPGCTLTISGDISGSNTLDKFDTGTLILTGNNSYASPTTITNGVLEGTTNSLTGGFQNQSTLRFNQDFDGTYGNIIAGPGIFQKMGTGTLTFSGINGAPTEFQFLGGTLRTNNVSTTINTGLLRFNGGALEITSASSFPNTITLDGDGTVKMSGITVGYTGTMGGTGKLIKGGTGTFDLGANVHTHSGGTQIDGGILKANIGGNLGTGPIIFNGGTLNTTAALTLTNQGTMQSGGTINVSAGTTTWSGNISGSGGLTKTGTGILLLSGSNNYQGGTIVSQGPLEGTTSSLQGNITNNGTVHFNQGSTGTYSGNLSGSGLVEINGGGAITFSGSNSYSGGTNIINGTLTGTTNSLQGSINNSDGVVFNQNFNGGFNGTLSGTGTLLKVGSGTVSFQGSHPMNGLSTVNQGTLKLNGILGGDVQVNFFGTFSGNGTTKNLVNNGTISPGNSIGVINVIGNYTQGPSGNLIIEVDHDGNNDVLNVTGIATLDGTLTASALPGLYSGDETYIFLNAGTVTPGFTNFVSPPNANLSVQYFPTYAQLSLNFRGSVLPVPLNDLPTNAKSIAEYLFCEKFYPDDADLLSVMRQLVILPPEQFVHELDELTPEQFGALPLTDLQNNRLIANSIISRTENFSWCDECKERKDPTSHEKLTSVWAAPVGQWQQQRGYNEQIGFNTQTYGFSVGATHLFLPWIQFGGGIGYTYTNLGWKENAGEGHWNTIYLSPSLGLQKNNWYFNFLAQGSMNFYSIDRELRFIGLHRTAHNSHHSFGLLTRIDGGYKFTFYRSENRLPITLLPTARLSYFNLFEESYTESGAGSVNLKINSKYSSYLQPEILLKLLRKIYIQDLCITPTFHLGWIGNFTLSSGTYTSRFAINESFCKSHFSVDSYDRNTNQLSMGAALLIKRFDQWQVEISYETRLLDRLFINNATLNADWRF